MPTPRNILLIVQYDGRRYSGWQRQKNALSVQQVIEEALEPLSGAPVRLTAAGRTDAGVHAAGQAVNFHTEASHSPAVFLRAGNARLPEDIVIREACEVPTAFSARRDARMRHYQYRIATGPVRPVFDRDRLWHVTFQLDPNFALQAASLFEGRHEFAAFRSIQCTASRTLLDMRQCRLMVEGERWTLDLSCRSFLHNMVRIITGAIIDVARGRLSLDEIRAALESGQRSPRIPVAPPHGLTLMKVEYPNLQLE